MKNLKIILLWLALCLPALAQNPVSVRSTNGFATNLTANGTFAGDGGQLTNINYNNLTGIRASTNTTILQLSPAGGNNELLDMFTGVANYPGQLSLGYGGGGDAGLYMARNIGTGTNVWGVPIDFLGGIGSIGLTGAVNQWYDIPQSWNAGGGANIQGSIFINWGAGPTASRLINAFPLGYGQPSVQPGLNIVDDNPFNGAGGLLIRGAFTNSARGSLVGTNADGIKIYNPQFGFQMLQIGDAYTIDGTALGAEQQQAPSDVILLNDSQIGLYVSINAQRTGDSRVVQVPLMDFDNRADYIWGIPYQVGSNVCTYSNSLYKYTLRTDGSTGEVDITNGSLIISNSATGRSLIGNSTNAGAYVLGETFDVAAMFNVNGSASFNTYLGGNDGAWTFSGAESHNFGLITKNGFFSGIVAGSGRQIHFYESSVTDLLGTPVSGQTLTDMGFFDSSGNLTDNGAVTATAGFLSTKANLAAPTAISVTASPFTFTAPAGANIQVYIGAGIVTAISKNGTALASALTLTGLTTLNLQAGETVTVTYTSAPTMKYSFF